MRCRYFAPDYKHLIYEPKATVNCPVVSWCLGVLVVVDVNHQDTKTHREAISEETYEVFSRRVAATLHVISST